MDRILPKIGFSDFAAGDAEGEQIYRTWAETRGLPIDLANPDILIHSCWGIDHIRIPARIKISCTGENVYPNHNLDDYSISHLRESLGGRNLYYPCAYHALQDKFPKHKVSPADAHRKFAVFIASQDHFGPGAKLRREFTEYVISHYKHVDCPGKILHNIDIPQLQPRRGDWVNGKRNVVSDYKFLISFENSNSDGYITEKLVDAFFCNTVPIYWGSEGNLTPFPKEAVICANDYPDFEALLTRIREVDENDELYLQILSANPMRDPVFRETWEHEHFSKLYAFLDEIVEKLQKRETLGTPSRGAQELDAAIYAMGYSPYMRVPHEQLKKRLINLIPISSWRKKLRQRFLKKWELLRRT